MPEEVKFIEYSREELSQMDDFPEYVKYFIDADDDMWQRTADGWRCRVSDGGQQTFAGVVNTFSPLRVPAMTRMQRQEEALRLIKQAEALVDQANDLSTMHWTIKEAYA